MMLQVIAIFSVHKMHYYINIPSKAPVGVLVTISINITSELSLYRLTKMLLIMIKIVMILILLIIIACIHHD